MNIPTIDLAALPTGSCSRLATRGSRVSRRAPGDTGMCTSQRTSSGDPINLQTERDKDGRETARIVGLSIACIYFLCFALAAVSMT